MTLPRMPLPAPVIGFTRSYLPRNPLLAELERQRTPELLGRFLLLADEREVRRHDVLEHAGTASRDRLIATLLEAGGGR